MITRIAIVIVTTLFVFIGTCIARIGLDLWLWCRLK